MATSPTSPLTKSTLIIGCGAIAHELFAVFKANNWSSHIEVQCLPAEWHNTPDKIVPAIRTKLDTDRSRFKSIFIAYGDCGTGGRLDALLDEPENQGIKRLDGDHCYAFFVGTDKFEKIANDDPGTFYLTDYLAANFDRLILDELGINDHPELLPMYFGNYNRLVYLSQQDNETLIDKAKQAASTLNLSFEHIHTGLETFDNALSGVRIVVE